MMLDYLAACKFDNAGEIKMALLMGLFFVVLIGNGLLYCFIHLKKKGNKISWSQYWRKNKAWLLVMAASFLFGFLLFGVKPLLRIIRLQSDVADPSLYETSGIIEDRITVMKGSFGIELNGEPYYIVGSSDEYDMDETPIEGSYCSVSYFPNSHYIWEIRYLIPLSDEMEVLFSGQEDMYHTFIEELRRHPAAPLPDPSVDSDLEKGRAIYRVQYYVRDDLLPHYRKENPKFDQVYQKYQWDMQAYYDEENGWYVVSFVPKDANDAVIFVAVNPMSWAPEYFWCSGSAFV